MSKRLSIKQLQAPKSPVPKCPAPQGSSKQEPEMTHVITVNQASLVCESDVPRKGMKFNGSSFSLHVCAPRGIKVVESNRLREESNGCIAVKGDTTIEVTIPKGWEVAYG